LATTPPPPPPPVVELLSMFVGLRLMSPLSQPTMTNALMLHARRCLTFMRYSKKKRLAICFELVTFSGKIGADC
jgi:hypothetical protein